MSLKRILDMFRPQQPPSPPSARRLRCKPGDIARIISDPMNRDRLVHVDAAIDGEPGRWMVTSMQSLWCYARARMCGAGTLGKCSDERLQPLRDEPGEDETLTWAGKPETLPAVNKETTS